MGMDKTSSEDKWLEWLRKARLPYGLLVYIDSQNVTPEAKLAVGEHMVGVLRQRQLRVESLNGFFEAFSIASWYAGVLYLLGKILYWLKNATWQGVSFIALLELAGFSLEDFTVPDFKGATLILQWFLGLGLWVYCFLIFPLLFQAVKLSIRTLILDGDLRPEIDRFLEAFESAKPSSES